MHSWWPKGHSEDRWRVQGDRPRHLEDNERLKRRIVDAICEEWERTEGDLDSMAVYDRHIGEGENFPLSEMEEFMYELVARDLISGTIHLGDVWITDIAPDLCG
jgi:hypothetical protein